MRERWIDGWRLAKALNQLDLPGVRFRSATFCPATHKWAGRRCGGVQLHVNDRRAFRPVTVGLHLIATVKALYPNEFAWRKDGERAGDAGAKNDRLHIDLLAGTDKVRRALDDGVCVADLIASWKDELDQFVQICRPYYLYE